MLKPMEELKISNSQLQTMLGDALGEISYLKDTRRLGHKALKILQRKACLTAAEAQRGLNCLAKRATQTERDLEAQLLAQDFQLSAAKLDVQQWKRRCAVQQLRLDSLQEDMDHLKSQHTLTLKEFGTQDSHCRQLQDQEASLKKQLEGYQADLASKTTALKAAEAQLHSAASLAGSTKTNIEQQLVAARGQVSVLEDQLKQANARADAAVRRAEAADAKAAEKDVQAAGKLAAMEERVRMADNISKERLQAAAEKADLVEQHLRQQVQELKHSLASQHNDRHNNGQDWHQQIKAVQLQLHRAEALNASLDHQVKEKMRRIQELEVASQQPRASPTDPEAAMETVSSIVDLLHSPASNDGVEPLLPPAPRPADGRPLAQGTAQPLAKAPVQEPRLTEQAPAPQRRALMGKPAPAAPAAASPQDMRASSRHPSDGPERPARGAAQAEVAAAAMTKARRQAGLGARTGKPAPKQNQASTTEQRADGHESASLDAGDTEGAADAAEQGTRRPARTRRQTQPFWMGTSAMDFSPASLDGTPSEADDDDKDPSFSNDPEAQLARKRNPPAEKRQTDRDQAAADEEEPVVVEEPTAEPGRIATRGGQSRVPDQKPAAEEPGHQYGEDNLMPAAAHEPDDDEPAGLSHAPDAGQAAQKAGHSHEEQAQEQQAAVPAAKPAAKRQSKAAGAGTKRGGGGLPKPKAGGKKSRLGPQAKAAAEAVDVQAGVAVLPSQKPAAEQPADAAAVQQDAPADAQVAKPVAETGNKPRKSGRPLGISKIDLRTVWGAQQTPASSQELNASGNAAKQAQPEGRGASQAAGPSSLRVSEESSATTSLQTVKEDASNVQAPAAAGKPGSKLESNPLAALNPKVLEAAAARGKAGKPSVPAQLGTRRSQLSKPTEGGSKRKLQPSSYMNDSLPRDLLLGPPGGFKIPRLKKPEPRA